MDEIEWFNLPSIFKEITGMYMDAMSLKFEVGNYPQIKARLSLKRLLEEMSKEELKQMIDYCEMRLEFHT